VELNQHEEIDFQKYWLVLRRRWLPAAVTFGAVTGLGVLLALMQKPVYEAEGRVLIKSSQASDLTGLGEGLGQLEALAMQNTPLDTQAEIVQSVPVLEQTIEMLDLRNEEGEPLTPEDLLKKLSVSGIRGTDVLSIKYEDTDPKRVADIVNAVIQSYISTNIQQNRVEAATARDFIIKQLPRTEAEVRKADEALRRFKEENRVLALEEEAKSTVELLAKLDEQIAQTRAQLMDANARSQSLQSRLQIDSRQAALYSELSQSSSVQDVLLQLQKVEQDLAVELTRYRPGYPSVANLERRATALKKLLQQRVTEITGSRQAIAPSDMQVGALQQDLIGQLIQTESNRVGLAQQLATLTNAQVSYQRRANTLPRLEEAQRELERQLQAAQSTYETLLTRLQEIQVAENQIVANARLVSAARPPEEPASNRLLLLGSGVVGLLLAIAMAFATDLVDRSIKTVKEAKEAFKHTLLGVIPLIKERKGYLLPGHSVSPTPRVISRDLPASPVVDAYQMLQANLKFLSSDKKLKQVVVTSSVAQEGKSEVAANLAMAIAQVGQRVLLVDADMRNPIQHHVWNLNNTIGLSNVLVEQTTLDLVIQSVDTNLDVLPAGVLPPNPVALLNSNRMAALCDRLAADYDFVLFDTPALAGTADAAVLGQLTDGILLVVRPNVVSFSSAKAAQEFLAQSGQHVLGFVVNGVDMKAEPDSYFYYREQAESPKAQKTISAKRLTASR
jgi:polysaccharide biosynthesis transport protein